MNNKILDKIDLDAFTEKSDMIKKTYNISDEEAGQYLLSFGPKRLSKIGVLEDRFGWREGFTKKSLMKRKENRRKKNKETRKMKQKMRRKA
ncbi:MAG: hypothetical protein ACOCRK_00995 [bacterium]